MKSETPAIKRLFFDVETSPNVVLSWRTGYKLNIPHENILQERALICICYKWEHKKKVESLTWNKGCDRHMVEEFLEVAKEADEIVGHNGDRFDIKWLNTRALFHRLGPVPKWKTIDTLKIAKSLFMFNSNRLDYLGQHLLGEGKISTGFGLWKDICLNNCPKAMKEMVKYCKKDVDLLQRVWEVMRSYAPATSHAGVIGGMDKWTCPHDGSTEVYKSKTRTTRMGTVQHQMHCKTCGAYYTISQRAYEQYLADRYDKEKNQ